MITPEQYAQIVQSLRGDGLLPVRCGYELSVMVQSRAADLGLCAPPSKTIQTLDGHVA